jgi:hypothetical protein
VLRSNCLPAALAGADANAILQRQDKDFAVANLTGFGRPRGMHDRLDRGLDEGFVDGDLQFPFRQQPYVKLSAAITSV